MTAPGLMGGVYALVQLGDAPPAVADLAALTLEVPGIGGIAARAIDPISPHAAHVISKDGRTTLFVGYLDEPIEVADRLRMAPTTSDAVLARAALDRFGPAMPAELLGRWIMVDHVAGGMVRMLVGIGGRTPLLYALRGDRLAIAPSIHALSRVSWIGRDLDEEAFLLSLTISQLDDARRTRTILRGVNSVPRGGCVTIAPGREPILHVVDPFVAIPRWTGTQGEAFEAAEHLLRRVVGQQLARGSAAGLLLSGGLDSSLIAWAIAAEGARALPALTSAVTPDRGVADETAYAAIVADTLGLPLHRVVPRADVNVYRPSAGALASCNFPPLSPRDYLYAAFAEAADAIGVTELLDGAHGELTFTALMPVRSPRDWPRVLARRARDTLRERLTTPRQRVDGLLSVALTRHTRDRISPILTEAGNAGRPERWERWAGEPWGYSGGARAPSRRDVAELRAGKLRFVRPFQDIRLLRLFAGFPASFMVEGDMTRWPARAIMKGRLPDSIRLRQRGMPFSPDYDLRMVEQAPVAIARIPAFRAAGCDEWLDLDWLREGLGRVAAGRSRGLSDTFRVQLTAQACEFLTWWRAGAS